MRLVPYFFLLIFSHSLYSQNILEWSPDYQLDLKDFQSPSSEIDPELNSFSVSSGSTVSFSFQMSGYEYLFAKNFNSKVSTVFLRNAAYIIANDSTVANQLLRFAQFDFDLNELTARQFRKELYEQKSAFSNASFFEPIFNRLQAENAERLAKVQKASNLGEKTEILEMEHKKVLNEIEMLSDFCKSCKPPKKKKKKK